MFKTGQSIKVQTTQGVLYGVVLRVINQHQLRVQVYVPGVGAETYIADAASVEGQ